MNSKYLDFVSIEPLGVIEANECHSQIGSLATDRFRRVFNEIYTLSNVNKQLYKALAQLVAAHDDQYRLAATVGGSHEQRITQARDALANAVRAGATEIEAEGTK